MSKKNKQNKSNPQERHPNEKKEQFGSQAQNLNQANPRSAQSQNPHEHAHQNERQQQHGKNLKNKDQSEKNRNW